MWTTRTSGLKAGAFQLWPEGWQGIWMTQASATFWIWTGLTISALSIGLSAQAKRRSGGLRFLGRHLLRQTRFGRSPARRDLRCSWPLEILQTVRRRLT